MTLPINLNELFPPPDIGTMPDPTMVAFSGGATGVECLVAGLFFLRFWRRTGESLFVAFAFAFWLLGANAVLPVVLARPAQLHGEIYLLRLAAFLLIILAIAGKNFRGRRG
jgi:hypothetical protein